MSLIQQRLENSNNLADVVILSAASACNVTIADMMSNTKRKEIITAKAVACGVLSDYGFGIREIARFLMLDPKGTSTFINTQDKRMEDAKYQRAYRLTEEFVEGYFNSDASLREQFNKLFTVYIRLESQYAHIKELLTTN